MKSFNVVCVALALTSCSAPLKQNQTEFKIDSFPAGASISAGTVTGTAPVSWIYTSNSERKTVPFTATWPSGAKVSLNIIVSPGRQVSYTFQRPINAPGLSTDIQWANYLQKRNEAEQQPIADALRSFNEDNAKRNASQRISKPIDCTSTKSGSNTISTTCF